MQDLVLGVLVAGEAAAVGELGLEGRDPATCRSIAAARTNHRTALRRREAIFPRAVVLSPWQDFVAHSWPKGRLNDWLNHVAPG